MSKKTNRTKAVIPYARRAVEDEYVQEQVRNAVARLSDAYARVSRQKADAAEDRKLYRSLRSAAVSIRKAAGAIAKRVPSGFHTSCKQTGFGDFSCKSRWSAHGRAFAGTVKISDRPSGNGAAWFYNAKLSKGPKHSAKGRGGTVTLTG